MFRSMKIQKIDILILEKHVKPIMKELGRRELVEFLDIGENLGKKSLEHELSDIQKDLLIKLKNLITFIKKNIAERMFYTILKKKQDKIPNNEKINSILEIFLPIQEKLTALKRERESIAKYKESIEVFSNINVSIEELKNSEYLYLKAGKLIEGGLSEIEVTQNFPFVVLPLNQENSAFFITSRKHRFRLNTLLREYKFREYDISTLNGIPGDIYERMLKKERDIDLEIDIIQKKIEKLSVEFLPLLNKKYISLQEYFTIEKQMNNFVFTESVCKISGWIVAGSLPKISKIINNLSEGTAIIEITEPKDIKEVREGKLKVPTKLKNRRWFRAFEGLVNNFGVPAYNEIEPTPIFSIIFILMFGAMFGDIGHGAILFILGIFLIFKKKMRDFGIILTSVSISSIIFGFLYGSVFGYEDIIKPIWLSPMDQSKMLFFLSLIVAFGIVIISIGLIINLINAILARDIKSGIFDKTGLAGIWFYWGILIILIKKIFFKKSPVEIHHITLLIILPLLILFFREPIMKLLDNISRRNKKKKIISIVEDEDKKTEKSIFIGFAESFIELLDTVLFFLTNSISFVRVGAFALAHAGFCIAIIALSDFASGADIKSRIIKGIILVFGNILVISLEGLVVSIQTMRLEYYEFFSKFYKGTGQLFKPFSLKSNDKVA